MEILASMAIASIIWAISASILIAIDLEERGLTVRFIWLRVLIVKYLHQYSKITKEETGRVGPLFYHFVIPINVALLLAIIILTTMP